MTRRTKRGPARALPILLSLGALLASAGSAAAFPVAIELETGFGAPLGPFPDGVPVSVDDASGSILAKIPDSSYNVLLDAQPKVGFSGGLWLLLGNWYLRGAISINSYDTVKASRYAFRRVGGLDLEEDLQNIYVGKIEGEELEMPESATIVTTRFGAGYRWYLLPEGPARPYIPLGIGGVVAVIEDQTRGGLSFHAGLGVDIHIHQHFDIGVKALYEWMGVFLPDNFQAGSAAKAIGTAATSEDSVLEAFLESMHTVQIGVSAIARF